MILSSSLNAPVRAAEALRPPPQLPLSAWRHEGFVTPRPAPAVALNAADQPLAVVDDLDERTIAVGVGVA